MNASNLSFARFVIYNDLTRNIHLDEKKFCVSRSLFVFLEVSLEGYLVMWHEKRFAGGTLHCATDDMP